MRRLVVILAVLVAGSGQALAQSAVSSSETKSETIRLRPGFQQDFSIRGDAKIDTIHVGDPTIAAVMAVSDRQFLINALQPEDLKAAGTHRATNVLVLDKDKNVLADLEVEVGYFAAGSHIVEIHKRVGGRRAGGGAISDQYAGVDKYLCSSIKCDVISRDKSEAPAQVIHQQNTNYNVDSNK